MSNQPVKFESTNLSEKKNRLQLFQKEYKRVNDELMELRLKYGDESLVNGNKEVDDKWNEAMAILRIINSIKKEDN